MSITPEQMALAELAGEDEDLSYTSPDVLEREVEELVDRIEKKALSWLAGSYTESKSQMDKRLTIWAGDEKRFNSETERMNDDDWFSKINPPRGARLIDLHKARMFSSTVPDTHRLDFFRLTPESAQPEGTPPVAEDALYAEMAEIALRNDLINGRFLNDYDEFLTDYFVFGNGYLMPVWEMDITWRFENVPNPEYNPDLPEEMNYRVDIIDGVEVPTPIRPTIRTRVPVRQFDAPKLRHVRATNVIPTEQDRNGAPDCTGVFIYDTVRLSDLRENEIASGGYAYANLEGLKLSSERSNIPEVPDSKTDLDYSGRRGTTAEIAKKLDRVTYLGRLRFDELIEELDLEEEMKSEAGILARQRLAEKWDWDEDKLSNWNTWVAEMVNDNGTLVRWQPSPYEEDRIPLVHKRLFSISKKTIGGSIYDRIRELEHARNKMSQLKMTHTQKMVEPPVMVIKDYIDPKWWNAMGGTLKYRRNMLIPGLKGANINQTIQAMEFSAAPIQGSDAVTMQLDAEIDAMSHLPAVRQGVTTGGQTATEISQMGASSDVMTNYMAISVERFLEEGIDWMLLLHHQYSDEPKLVRYFDKQGELQFTQVPPEVWTRRYKVNLQGWESIGNREVRAMNFKEFAGTAQSYGWGDPQAILSEYAKILQVRDPMRMIKAPEPAPPQAKVTGSVNVSLDHELLPASVVAKYFQLQGMELTPEEIAQMQEMEKARAVREVADQANVPIPLEAALPPSWIPQTAGQPLPPQLPPGAMPGGMDPNRSHHAPGEIDRRQQGLHDAVGLQNSLGKQMLSPASSRRAM